MKIWFDTEFLDHGDTVDLVSLGAVREDGKEFYAEIAECDLSKANDWVAANVLPHLTGPKLARARVRDEFVSFAGGDPEFWGDYCAWDWWLLCRLMGGFMKRPDGWPGWCNDIQTIRVLQGRTLWHPPEIVGAAHNALNDARYIRAAYYSLRGGN